MGYKYPTVTVVFSLLFLAACLGGCGSEDSGMSASQEKMAQDVDNWAKSSDGDWSKLTSDQQQTLIKSAGNEATAKMVLQMRAHPPAPVAPGRPTNVPSGK